MFLQSNILLDIYYRVSAIDQYETSRQQDTYRYNKLALIYLGSIAFIVISQETFLRKWLSLLSLTLIWAPQVYRNAIMGYRHIPSFAFSVAVQIHVLLLPEFLMLIDGNFLLIKPDYNTATGAAIVAAIMILCLKVQQKRPRFLLPKSMYDRLLENYYKYEIRFEDDAARSTASLLSHSSDREQVEFHLL